MPEQSAGGSRVSRRALLAALATGPAGAQGPPTRQATGIRIGDVTQTTAVVWMRRTLQAGRNREGEVRRGRPARVLPGDVDVSRLEGACPGAPGRVRLHWTPRGAPGAARASEWVSVGPRTDFSHQFRLSGLRPGVDYELRAETADPDGRPDGILTGGFRTPPAPDQAARVVFATWTGQAYRDIDDPEGFHLYPAVARLRPDFVVPNGDLVYYDSEDPRATTEAVARYHWQRMYGYPRHVELHRSVAAYWRKDDHDLLQDDCFPEQDSPLMKPLTWADGLRLFREQAPQGERPYLTVRWGRHLQVWLTEGREYRSSNIAPDGPGKSIWGAEQKRWLKESLLASDARWKILVSPTPIVGPDRPNKADNHSNAAFKTEGDEMRRWFARNLSRRFFIACGDRHWQYHSVHPETGVHEFSGGPASDPHAGGSPGLDPAYHRFHRVGGGFLAAEVSEAGSLVLRLHDVRGQIIYEHRAAE